MKSTGFENQPHGMLIGQTIDLSQPTGVAYERSIHFEKEAHRHERHILIFPRGQCRMNVIDHSASRVLELDQDSFGFVRAGVEHSDHGVTNIYDTLALLPELKEVERVAHKAQFGAEALKIILAASSAKLPRSSWMQSLLDRYYAERIVNHKLSVFRITCLSHLILSEWLEIHSGDSDHPDGALSYEAGEGMYFVERVRQTLESRIFQQVRLDEIANSLSVSVSTLQRKFKDGAGTTIVMYLKKRRLEEGAKLLLRGKYNVAEVTDLVGYADPSSFSKAFKQEYGVSPAEYKLRRS